MTKNSLSIQQLVPFMMVTFLIAALFLWQRKHEHHKIDDLRVQIRRELEEEFDSKLERLVQEEVKRVYHTEMARSAAEREDDVAAANIVPDDVLARHIAGQSVGSPTTIGGGIVKTGGEEPVIQLAKNEVTPIVEGAPAGVEHEPPRPQSIERTMQQKGSVLLPKGSFILEPSLTYAHFSTNRIHIQGVTILEVFTIGPVSTQRIQRDLLIQTTSLKYGLMDNLQGEVRVPARYEFDRITNTDQTSEDTRSKGGLGDVELSLSRQIGWEEGWKPDLIASMGVKTITGEPIYDNKIALGTGHWSVRTSLIAAKSSDPVVVFGSLSYIYSFERAFDNFGDVKPGDTFAYSLGLAIALSYQTAINFSFDQSISQKLERNGTKVTGSFVNSANLKTGLNWAVNDALSVDFSVAAGLTDDSPDFTAEIRFPIRF